MIDAGQLYYGDTVCGFYLKKNIEVDIKYVLGLLNSRLIEWFYKKTTVPKANEYYIYKTMFLQNIPIRKIDQSDKQDMLVHDNLVSLVDTAIELNNKAQSCSGNEKEQKCSKKFKSEQYEKKRNNRIKTRRFGSGK